MQFIDTFLIFAWRFGFRLKISATTRTMFIYEWSSIFHLRNILNMNQHRDAWEIIESENASFW